MPGTGTGPDTRPVLRPPILNEALGRSWLEYSEDLSRFRPGLSKSFMKPMTPPRSIGFKVPMGVEMAEMTLREPILDYLIPESELTLIVAGLTIVVGVFGFAVAYNLLVEEGTPSHDENDDYNGSSGPLSPIRPSGPDAILEQRNSRSSVLGQQRQQRQQKRLQQQTRPRLLFTKASTYLLSGNTIFLALVLLLLVITLSNRSAHLNQLLLAILSDGTNAVVLMLDGNHAEPTCTENPAYGYKVPCKADLARGFEQSQRVIGSFLKFQVAMLLHVLFLVLSLSLIGVSKIKEQKQGFADSEEEAASVEDEDALAVQAVDGRRREGGRDNVHYEPSHSLLLDDSRHQGGETLIFVGDESEPQPERVVRNRPVVPSLV
ncbi:hypothetical protein BGZ94_006242 [Podila epigama]|nr:hypothetical protein BGZ94_006242 [Podila epigama]